MAGFYPTCKFSSTLPDPAQLPGSFVANGASAIPATSVAGVVASVRRLEDAGALPFFRVKINTRVDLSALSTIITGTVRGVAIGDDPSFNLVAVTADPATTKGDDEFDVVFLDAGVAVDTAGWRFDFHIDAAQGRVVAAP
jgi:hypothetical protein